MNDPATVWRLIQKADEVLKYAGNRDATAAYEQARAALDEAEQLSASLVDQGIAENFRSQIEIRRADIMRRTTHEE